MVCLKSVRKKEWTASLHQIRHFSIFNAANGVSRITPAKNVGGILNSANKACCGTRNDDGRKQNGVNDKSMALICCIPREILLAEV